MAEDNANKGDEKLLVVSERVRSDVYRLVCELALKVALDPQLRVFPDDQITQAINRGVAAAFRDLRRPVEGTLELIIMQPNGTGDSNKS